MSAKNTKAWSSIFSNYNLTQLNGKCHTSTTEADAPVTPRRSLRSTSMKTSESSSDTSTVKKRRRPHKDKTTDDISIVDISKSDAKEAIASVPFVSDDNASWIDTFAPKCSEDLAVHAKKVEEFRNWLNHCAAIRGSHPALICLLTGPSGSGKTTLVRLLAAELQYDVKEWINPVDDDEPQADGGSYTGSQLNAFKDFLLRASRYKSLLDKFEKRLLLVEDFPNALIGDAASFETIMEDYIDYGQSPLVFIVTDAKSRALNISYNLFTDQLKSKLQIEHISFNPIAATLMQKAMKRFCSIMREKYAAAYSVPSTTIVDSIVVCAQGDIRNALINLHFSSLNGAPALHTKSIQSACEQSKTSKSKKKKESTLKSVGRDESITMMHALGRVFNPKFNDLKTLLHSPEQIAENYSTEPKKFCDFVFANYLPHFRELEHVLAAVSDLSLTDVLLCEYRNDTVALVGINLAVRSVMLANKAPVTGWMPVRGPKRLKIDEEIHSEERKLLGLNAKVSKSLYASDYGTFLKIIANNKKN